MAWRQTWDPESSKVGLATPRLEWLMPQPPWSTPTVGLLHSCSLNLHNQLGSWALNSTILHKRKLRHWEVHNMPECPQLPSRRVEAPTEAAGFRVCPPGPVRPCFPQGFPVIIEASDFLSWLLYMGLWFPPEPHQRLCP